MGQKDETFADIEEATPALRRYARALCVGMDSATVDDLVQSAIESACGALREKPRAGDPSGARRCAYRTLTMLAREAAGAENAARRSARQPPIVHALAELSFDERASILLVALEGFSYDAAAQICGARREALVTRLMRARATLSRQDLRPRAPSDGARRVGGHLRVVK
jgi:DNA-directed RNA polymerase specialized sigma24 family protein